jgi:uncharacterized protein
VKIWVDADSCPGAVRDIVVSAAHKRAVDTIFVANKILGLPDSRYISTVRVDSAPDAADAYINEHAQTSDLVITQDILLAEMLVKSGIAVIDLRGSKFSEENIGDRVSIRQLLADRRDSGEITSGPKPYGEKDKRAFAASFDRELTKLLKA